MALGSPVTVYVVSLVTIGLLGQGLALTAESAGGLRVNFTSLGGAAGDSDPPGAFRVSEYSAMGTFLGIVQVSSDNEQLLAHTICRVHEGAGHQFNLWGLGPHEWALVLTGQLDREIEISMSFPVTCQSYYRAGDSVTLTLTALIEDVNDNAPVFIRNNFVFDVMENCRLGTVVGQVSARDRDSGENARLTLSLDSNPWFTMDQTGTLSVSSHLDYELSSSYSLTVRARDHGTPPLEGRATITVNILDLNDNTPYFEAPSYNFTVTAGVPSGTQVGDITVFDVESGMNGEVTARLQALDEGSNIFSLVQDGSSPVIHLVTAGQLSPDQSGAHHLTVVATDGGLPSLSTTVPVTVVVTAP